ncbi:hypothetical protein GCM10020000_20360 [Streptomyces olivoverticillatus]
MVDGGDQIALDRTGSAGVRFRTREHVQVVGGIRQVVARCDGLEPLAQPVQGGEQGGDGRAGGERVGGAPGGVDVVQRAQARGGSQQGERGAQPGQRSGHGTGAGDARQCVAHLRGEVAQGRGLGGEGGALGGVREEAAGHQVPDVFEGAALGELDGGVLAVVVEALGAADVPPVRCP